MIYYGWLVYVAYRRNYVADDNDRVEYGTTQIRVSAVEVYSHAIRASSCSLDPGHLLVVRLVQRLL